MFRQSHPKKRVNKIPSPASLESQPLPADPPVPSIRNMPLHGALICYTGLTIQQREEVNKKIRTLGGQVSSDLREDITHLIASKIGTAKYKVAMELGIPVLTPAWLDFIDACWSKGELIDMKKVAQDFVMGPLTGCSICVTGFLTEERHEVHSETIAYGGKYTNDLLKGVTTHLICGVCTTRKYATAMAWGVQCITRQWLADTIANLERADESLYPIPPENLQFRENHSANGEVVLEQSKKKNQGGKAQDGKSRDGWPITPSDQMFLEACQIFLCPSIAEANATRFRKMIRIAGGIHVTDYDPQEVTHVVVPSDKLEPSTLALFDNDSAIPYIVHQDWLRRSNRERRALPEAEFIVPFPTRSEDGQPKPVRFEGASTWTTDPAINPRDTSGRTRTNIASLRSHSKGLGSSDNRASAVSQNGSALNQVSVMAYRDKLDESLASSTSNTTPTSPPSNLSPKLTRRGLRSRTESGILTDALDDLTMSGTGQLTPTQHSSMVRKNVTPLQEEDETPASNIFLGLYITSFGCSAWEVIRDQTVAFGGTYFVITETPPADAHVKTIVPLSMPLDQTKDLPGVVMTILWFERSLTEERVIPRGDHFLFKPMAHIPVPGFEKLRISVSSNTMKEIEYRHIQRAIKILGATFLDKLHTTDTDVLICDIARGPKYEFMSRTGRPIIKMDWFMQCIEEGQLLPYKGFLLVDETLDTGGGSQDTFTGTHSMASFRSEETLRASRSMTMSSLAPTQQAVPSDTPLDGLSIWLPTRVTGDHRAMQDMITRMGARLFTSYDPSASHFIHGSKATADAKRDLKVAKRDNMFIVSPDWLYKCRETRLRVDERDYPETFDGRHTTLNTTTTQLRTPQERPPLAVLPRRSSSPSLRSSGRTVGPGRKMKPPGRSATVGNPVHGHQSVGQVSPTQTYQGTAAGAGVGGGGFFSERDSSATSSVQASSADSSMDTLSMGMTDAQLTQQDENSHGESAIWQPVPAIQVARNSNQRKRRRAVPIPEGLSTSITTDMDLSAICETPDEANDGSNIPENYFDKSSERYGEDAVYWVDVEGREKKRALLESLGYKTYKPVQPEKSDADRRLEALSRDLETQRFPDSKLYFLMTGMSQADRGLYKRTIQQLGGVLLEDATNDHDEWQTKCTHLVTNAQNPPRTAKLVIAKACKAFIVYKTFLEASEKHGAFVDETPHRLKV